VNFTEFPRFVVIGNTRCRVQTSATRPSVLIQPIADRVHLRVDEALKFLCRARVH
jgi:hypothetical protein